MSEPEKSYASEKPDTCDSDSDRGGRRRVPLPPPLLLLIVLLLLCGGFGYLKWWRQPTGDPVEDRPGADATAGLSPQPSSPGPGAEPSATASAVASATPSTPASTGIATMPLHAVPNLVGRQAEDAEKILNGLGFTELIFVSEQDLDEPLSALASWVVTKQSARPGTRLALDAVVTLTCIPRSNGNG